MREERATASYAAVNYPLRFGRTLRESVYYAPSSCVKLPFHKLC